MTASDPRTASRIDVFVAIIAIVALLSITLPAVQGARTDADLTASQDNLRKIGAGVAAHATAHGRIPYGTFHDNTQPKGTADPRFHTFYSGFVAILPYVGEDKLFDVYDVTLSPDDDTDAAKDGWSNKRVTESRPKIFLSPAMPEPEAPPALAGRAMPGVVEIMTKTAKTVVI